MTACKCVSPERLGAFMELEVTRDTCRRIFASVVPSTKPRSKVYTKTTPIRAGRRLRRREGPSRFMVTPFVYRTWRIHRIGQEGSSNGWKQKYWSDKKILIRLVAMNAPIVNSRGGLQGLKSHGWTRAREGRIMHETRWQHQLTSQMW